MTAAQIIREIQGMPVSEQAEVIRFVYQLDAERQLTGKELSALAERMVKASDPDLVSALREEIRNGFYAIGANA
jgi:hypothetical protein